MAWARSAVAGDPDPDEGGGVPSAIPVVNVNVVSAAEETACRLWRQAAAGAICSHPSVSALMVSAAVTEMLIYGVSYWLWKDDRWWRARFSREQPGEKVSVNLPPAEYDPRAPDAESYTTVSEEVDRDKVAGLWWSPLATGLGDRQAGLTEDRRALRNLLGMMADEYGGPRGSMLPTPNLKDESRDLMQDLYARLAGGMRSVRSQAVMSQQVGAKVTKEWEQQRIGADPPAAMVMDAEKLHNRVLQSYGVPGSLFVGSTTAGREAWRFFIQSAVRPQLRIFAEEMSSVIGKSVRFSWGELESAELQSKARAFKAFTDGGMDAEKAAKVVGVEW